MKKILIVDDDPAIRLLLQTALSTFGYEVIEASDGAMAFERITENPPDLIITDVKMPVMGGYELLKKLKGSTEFSGIPLLLLTAGSLDKAAPDDLVAMPDDYLFKPFTMKELRSKVERWLMKESS